MSSVGGIQRSHSEAQQPAYQVQARASYRERSTQTAGSLSVRTDDGDVVNISFASQSSQSVGRYSATDGSNRVSGVERTSSSAYAVEVSVEGTLDDDEVEDIRKLLSKLASQVHNPNPRRIENQFEKLDSLESFQFGFEQTQSSSFERAAVLERPLPPELAPEPLPESAPVDNPDDGQVAEQPAEVDAFIAVQPEVAPAETTQIEPVETPPPSGDIEVADLQTLLTEFTVSANSATLRNIEEQFEQIESLSSFQFGFEQTESSSFERIDIAA